MAGYVAWAYSTLPYTRDEGRPDVDRAVQNLTVDRAISFCGVYTTVSHSSVVH